MGDTLGFDFSPFYDGKRATMSFSASLPKALGMRLLGPLVMKLKNSFSCL